MIAPPRLHMRERSLGQIEHGGNIDREGAIPLLVGDLLRGLEGHLVGGVVDEHIDAPERVGGLAHQLAAMPGIGDVARHQQTLPPGLLDQALGLAGVFVLVQIGDEEVGAFAGKGQCDRPADARNRRR